MNVQAQYQQKRMSANDAIRVVKNGDTIVVPTAVGEPPTLLTALSDCLLYTSPSPRDRTRSRMPSSA